MYSIVSGESFCCSLLIYILINITILCLGNLQRAILQESTHKCLGRGLQQGLMSLRGSLLLALDPQHPQMNSQPPRRQHLWEKRRVGHIIFPAILCGSQLSHKHTSPVLRVYIAIRGNFRVNLSTRVSPEEGLWNKSSILQSYLPWLPREMISLVSLTWLSRFHSISPVYRLLISASFAPNFDTAGLLYLSLLFNLPTWHPLGQCLQPGTDVPKRLS